MIPIDGSFGEGGGQILRTALGLSMVTGRPFRMTGIRANRPKPGLMRQHLTGVTAAAAICAAEVTGAAIGSGELTFVPNGVRPGVYAFAVGTAGSVGLVLQAILPALVTAAGPSRITLDGGTHAAHAPPVDFLVDTLLPVLNRTGATVAIELLRHGFYPAGGGRIVVDVTPTPRLAALTVDAGDPWGDCRATAVVAGLPVSIAERELARVSAELGLAAGQTHVRQLPADQGPGNVVMVSVRLASVTETFTGFGARGVSAEAVASSAAEEARRYLAIGAPVGPHLADQLPVLMAMADGGSAYVTGPLTRHTTTNLDTIGRFLPDVRFTTVPAGGERVRVATGM